MNSAGANCYCFKVLTRNSPAMSTSDNRGKTEDEVTDEFLRREHKKAKNTISRALHKGKKSVKYGTARFSGIQYNQEVEDQTVIKACIHDSKDLRSKKLDELISKGVTHLKIEDDDNTLKVIPEEISRIVTLRSFTLIWSKVKFLPEFLLHIQLKELCIQKCPLKSIEGIHTMNTLVTLDLDNDDLTHIPIEIGEMGNLQHLSLTGNGLTHIPESVGNLRRLKTLKISGNSLSQLPLDSANLGQLETLDASHNRIKIIPDVVGSLRSLLTLRLSHNQICALPKSFRELKNLRHLYLTSNHFTEVPAVLADLTELQTLHMVSNKISKIPAPLPNVGTLLLDKNALEELPAALFGFGKLQKLSVQYNNLMSVSPNIARLSSLKTLYLNGNNLTEIPDTICFLDELRHLGLRETKLQELPQDLRKPDTLKRLSVIDIENTQLDFQYNYALRERGITGLKEVMQTKYETQADTPNEPATCTDDEEEVEEEEIASSTGDAKVNGQVFLDNKALQRKKEDSAPTRSVRDQVMSIFPGQLEPENRVKFRSSVPNKSDSATAAKNQPRRDIVTMYPQNDVGEMKKYRKRNTMHPPPENKQTRRDIVTMDVEKMAKQGLPVNGESVAINSDPNGGTEDTGFTESVNQHSTHNRESVPRNSRVVSAIQFFDDALNESDESIESENL